MMIMKENSIETLKKSLKNKISLMLTNLGIPSPFNEEVYEIEPQFA